MKTNVLCKVGRDLIGQGAAEEILLYPSGNIRITFTKSGSTITTKVGTLHADGLGSVRVVTDANGLAVERTSYRPYGEEVTILQPLTLPETKGFIGERFDDQSDLQYLNARYYDPKLAMFIQPDWWEVMKEGVGTNRYFYGFGDPANSKDPGGHEVYYEDVDPDEKERLEKDYKDGRTKAEQDIKTAKKIEKSGKLNPQDDVGKDFLSRMRATDEDGKVTMDDVTRHRMNLEKVLHDIGEPGSGVSVHRKSVGPGGVDVRASMKRGVPTDVTIYDSYFDVAPDGGYKVIHEMGHGSLELTDNLPKAAKAFVDKVDIFEYGEYNPGGYIGYRGRGVSVANQLGVLDFNDRFTCSMDFDRC